MKRNMLAVATACIVLMGLVGEMDYQDEIQEEQRYVEMVCNDLWPDYQGIVNKEKECAHA